MIPTMATTLLGQIHRDLTELQTLRQKIRSTPDHINRNKAITRHSRTLNRIVIASQRLEDAGILNGFPTAT